MMYSSRKVTRPSSFTEWMVGASIPNLHKQPKTKPRSPSPRRRLIVHVETSEIDCDQCSSSSDNITTEAYPKSKRSVHFKDEPKAKLKPSLKKPKSGEEGTGLKDSESELCCRHCKASQKNHAKGNIQADDNTQPDKEQVKETTNPTNKRHSQAKQGQPAINAKALPQLHGSQHHSRHRTSNLEPRMSNRIIRSSRAEVVDREDVIEDSCDPRPNAFFDTNTGILRVYHGNIYGNPYGSIHQGTASMPIGTFRSHNHSYHYGMPPAQPAMMPYGHHMPSSPYFNPGYPPAYFGNEPSRAASVAGSINGNHSASGWNNAKPPSDQNDRGGYANSNNQGNRNPGWGGSNNNGNNNHGARPGNDRSSNNNNSTWGGTERNSNTNGHNNNYTESGCRNANDNNSNAGKAGGAWGQSSCASNGIDDGFGEAMSQTNSNNDNGFWGIKTDVNDRNDTNAGGWGDSGLSGDANTTWGGNNEDSNNNDSWGAPAEQTSWGNPSAAQNGGDGDDWGNTSGAQSNGW